MANAFLSAFDALAFPAFAGAGLADAAVYTQAGTGQPSIPCTVLIDTEAEWLLNDGTARTDATTITVQRAEVPIEPKHRATFVVDGTTYRVDSVRESDGSAWTCLVTR